jgi:hypothetical protein
MSLELGVDTYITIEEMEEYLTKYYVPDDPQMAAWNALSTESKEVYLRKAISEIERLKYIGQKYDKEQMLAFPRIYTAISRCTGEVPNTIKWAQAEEALELSSPTEDSNAAEALSGNVKSYRIGNLSETYKNVDGMSPYAIIKSVKAQRLIAPYLGGGYSVR